MILQVTSAWKQAIRSLRSSKLRSLLTMLGIIIGVGSVIVMLTVGRGAQRLILDEIEGLGSNLVFVISGAEGNRVGSALTKSITNEDIEYMERNKGQVPSLKRAATFTTVYREQMQVGTNPEVGIGVQGVQRNYLLMTNLEAGEGMFWSEEDEASVKKVAVLGVNAKKNIFGENAGNVVGKRIKIKGQSYTIVGVLAEKSSSIASALGDDTQDNIYVPTLTAQKLLLGTGNYVWGVMMEARDKDSIESLKNEVTSVLQRRHKIKAGEDNDFQISTQEQITEILGTATGIFTLFLSAIAAISLIVGGIGIMNIMLVVVTERTREIGLRKSIGARRSDILVQFLIEALIITGIGGIIGIVGGLGLSALIALLGGLTFILDPGTIIMAFGISALFGVFFGMYPANKASKLDPIQALRS